RLTQDPVAEHGEVIRGVAVARDHPLQLARDIVDPQCRVQAGLFHDIPSMLPASRYFPDQEEPLLSDTLSELPDHVAERAERLRADVRGAVDAQTSDIGVSDPEAIDQGEAGQGRGRLAVLPGSLNPDVKGFQ